MTDSKIISTQALLGGIVVLIGVLLLLDSIGLAETGTFLQYVPSLFVLLGLYALLVSDFRNIVGPIIVIAVAVAWQLAVLDVLTDADLISFWPVLVILFGLSILLGRLRTAPERIDTGWIDGVAIFGGQNQRSTATAFSGGDVSAVFGGYELDLRDARITERPARINAMALFGGVDILVPREWRVQVDVLPVFGAATDDRPRRDEEHEEVDLVVTGFAAFGGVAVTD
ncbi:LiaF domain-containing protein [Halostella sp. PRR32]|uniref:LiaF transmembrane domain-containing protein n=1 Tax=Halostella sp. PRR32 TaxID=3098147 RepID=UPI002B1D10C7|nr:LiaF domain-containing protein [Halostella sp. PRR32]